MDARVFFNSGTFLIEADYFLRGFGFVYGFELKILAVSAVSQRQRLCEAHLGMGIEPLGIIKPDISPLEGPFENLKYVKV